MKNVYLVQNETDEEYTPLLGCFLSENEAIEAAKTVCIDDLENADDVATVEVHRVPVGMHGYGNTVATFEFSKRWIDDECSDYVWELNHE